MIAYKIVYTCDYKYFSLIASGKYYNLNRAKHTVPDADHPFIVEYKLDEWTTPKVKNTPLLAFSSEYFARNFFEFNCNGAYERLLKCEYKLFPKKPWFACPAGDVLVNVEHAKSFWENGDAYHDYDYPGYHWPVDTIFCSAIKPLRIL